MPAVQTTYGTVHSPAVEGMVANMEDHNVITRVLESAAGIGFGKIAMRGTVDGTIKVSAAASDYLGITVLDTTQAQDSFLQYANVPVMTKGVIWVTAGATVVQGDPVYYVPATGVLTNVDGGGANTLVPNATWDSSAASGALAKLRLA
jgi:hypothetical protein